MAVQTPFSGNAVSTSNSTVFIPKLWATEIRRARDQNLTMRTAVEIMNYVGKKGDTVNIPIIGRAAVYKKLPQTPVNLQTHSNSLFTILFDQYNESSFMIEDIIALQSQYELRSIYTKEAGYALQRDADNIVLALRAGVPTTQQIVSSDTGLVSGNPLPISEAAILAGKQALDEADVPLQGRFLKISPAQAVDMLLINRFTSRDFVPGQPVMNGMIGEIHGFSVEVTSQIGNNSLVGYVNGTDASGNPNPGQPTPGVLTSPYLPTQDAIVGTGLPRGKTGAEVAQPFQTAIMGHPSWAKMVVQKNIGTEYSRENMYQADLLVTTQVVAAKLYRRDHVVLIHTSN